MTKLRSRLTYANVMATIAVFLALGGGAIAAFQVPKKSVGPKQLKANAVTNPKVGDAAINSAELANLAVNTGKLADGAVSTGKLADGAVNGAKVANGSIGVADTAVLDTTVTQNFGNVAANSCQSISKAVSAVVQPTDQVVVIPNPTTPEDVAGDGSWYSEALMAEGGPTNIAPEAAIKLHVCNVTGAATADPGNTVFRVLVFR